MAQPLNIVHKLLADVACKGLGELVHRAGKHIREVARVCAGEGAKIHCVTLGSAFNPEAVKDPEGYVQLLMNALDAAKFLGAKVVNHYCYHINLSENHDYARMERYWLEPLRHAREIGVRLALENEAHDGTRTPELMLDILRHFDDEYFLTNYDATNYFHASCEGYPAGYEILKPYLGYVHLKNGCLHRPGANQPEYNLGAPMSGHYAPGRIQYCPLPDGAVNIPGLLTRLAEDDSYSGVASFEPHTQTDHVEEFYARESQWLRSLGFFAE